jgi:hypothetical protein
MLKGFIRYNVKYSIFVLSARLRGGGDGLAFLAMSVERSGRRRSWCWWRFGKDISHIAW